MPTESELDLLRSYITGPKIWDAAVLQPEVYSLTDQGLIEPVDTDGRVYRLTAAGRELLHV